MGSSRLIKAKSVRTLTEPHAFLLHSCCTGQGAGGVLTGRAQCRP